jgi:ABC-type multidrug transport system fused ATPase/permease subunit
MSYVEQEPFIFSGTVQEKINMGSQYDEIKMEEIINLTALKKDLE